jgi:plastocyanin
MFGIVSTRRRSTRVASIATIVALLATVMLGGTTALAQQAPQITVVMRESSFTPRTVTLTVGQPVQLVIQNSGGADHNLLSRDAPDSIPISNVTYQKADNDPRQLRSYEANNILDTDAVSGHTSMVTFTPTKVGTFRFFSDEGEDEMNGMVGSFVVVAAGGQGAAAPASAAAPATATPAGSSVARDGQSLSGQSPATQAMFTSVWGAAAAQRWAQEHDAGR